MKESEEFNTSCSVGEIMEESEEFNTSYSVGEIMEEREELQNGSADRVGAIYSGLYEEGEVEHINCGIGPNL